MSVFASKEEIERAAAKAKAGSLPWPDFDENYLLQEAPQSLLKPDGSFLHSILRFDGNTFNRVETPDLKFASWLVSESSMAYALGLGSRFLDSAKAWVSAIVETPVWDPPRGGPASKAQIDLNYGNASYACAFFLDLCGEACEKEFRERLVSKMREQVALGDGRFLLRPLDKHPYTQNHFYIPFAGYLSMCAALKPYWSEAESRLKEGSQFAPLIFKGLGEDGWYYEGLNYCHYAFIWLIRLAELSRRNSGFDASCSECLGKLRHFFKWTLFPKGRHFFNIGDNSSKSWSFGRWEEASLVDERNWNDAWINNFAHVLYWVGARTGDPECRAVADAVKARGTRWREGFWTLLWDAPKGAETEETSHLFEDFGVWASDSKDSEGKALRVLAKCGPPMGHGMKIDDTGRPEYLYNAGHVHPDAGSVYAAWEDLPVILGPGYLGRKAGAWQNTISIDGVGQQDDRLYHALNSDVADCRRLAKLSIAKAGNGVEMDFSSAYRESQGVEKARRSLKILSARSFEIEDEVALSKDGRIEARFRVSDPPRFVDERTLEWSVLGRKMRFELLESSVETALWAAPGEATTINDDGSPGPLEAGLTCQRGHQIIVQSSAKGKAAKWKLRFSVL